MIEPLCKICLDKEKIGHNIILKKLQMDMAEKIYDAICKDYKHLYQYLPWIENIKTLSDEKEYLKICLDNWDLCDEFIFGMFNKIDGRYMGNVCLHNIKWEYNKAEIGYWILSEFEGKGFVRESVSILEKMAFSLGFNRIEIRCSSKNLRSMTIPLRLGYRLEGINSQDIIINGSYEDSACFSKLRNSFFCDIPVLG